LKTRWLEGWSLQRRVFLVLLVPLALLLVGSVISDLHTAIEPANAARDKALADAALAVAGHLEVRGNRPHLELSRDAEALLRANSDDAVYYAVFDAHGRLAAGDAGLGPPLSRATNPAFYGSTYEGRPVRVVALRAPTEAGTAVIKVAETTNSRRLLLRRATVIIALSNFLLIGVTLVLVYLAVRSGLSPLERIRAEIAARSARDLRPLYNTPAPSEVRPLVDAVNRLLGLLREAAAAQDRFLANAAHPARRAHHGAQRRARRDAIPGGGGQRPRHPRERPHESARALLPRARYPGLRHRARPRDRAGDRPAARGEPRDRIARQRTRNAGHRAVPGSPGLTATRGDRRARVVGCAAFDAPASFHHHTRETPWERPSRSPPPTATSCSPIAPNRSAGRRAA
jgi:hypothetical protein